MVSSAATAVTVLHVVNMPAGPHAHAPILAIVAVKGIVLMGFHVTTRKDLTIPRVHATLSR